MNDRRQPRASAKPAPDRDPGSSPRNARADRNPGRPSAGDRQGVRARAGKGRVRAGSLQARRTEQVTALLREVLAWEGPLDAVVSRWFRMHPQLGARDRTEVAEAVYNVVRHLRRYRHFAQSGSGDIARRLALLGLFNTLGRAYLQSVLSEREASWIDHVQSLDAAVLPRPVRYSLPDWLDEAFGRLDNPEALMAAMLEPAYLDVRVNPLKIERDALLQELREDTRARGLDGRLPAATPWSPWGIRIFARPDLSRWPRFLDGSLEVQDEGSQLLALLVAPRRGELIIDFCAGAGGKTLLLGGLMRSTGRLYAFDVSAPRLDRLTPRLARSGLSNVEPVLISSENDARVKRLRQKARRVLVDAPCSGTGTLRRNPDIKWRQSPQNIAELCELQARILASAARCVQPGGRLVYATCSLLEQENEAQVEAFLARHPDFELKPVPDVLAGRTALEMPGPFLKLRPDVHGTDGFFAAVFDRRTDAG